MIQINKGTIPTKKQFDEAWSIKYPNQSYLNFDDSRVGICSIPAEQIWEELQAAYTEWSDGAPGAMDTFNWMINVLIRLGISWK